MKSEKDRVSTIWMGLGIFERLYSNKKIQGYFDILDKLPNPKLFLLADEITGTNTFVLNAKKFDRVQDAELLGRHKQKAHENFTSKYVSTYELIVSNSVSPEKWRIEYWTYLSEQEEYQVLLHKLRDSLERFENHYLKKEVLRVTIFGFGARLRKNFTNSFVEFVFDKNFYRYLETLSEYAIEEIAAIFYLARRGYIKAGHEEERPYDELALMFYERLQNEFLELPEPPKFIYF